MPTPPAGRFGAVMIVLLALGLCAVARPASVATAAIDNGEQPINVYTTANQRCPRVAMNADGRIAVVWESDGQDGDQYGLYWRLYDADGHPLTGEILANTTTANNQDYAHLAMDADGNVVIAWQSSGQDGSDYGVIARVFDADGNPLTAEFPVNTSTAQGQNYPWVALDDDNNITVAWDSHDQDGDGVGVYARRFTFDGTPLTGEIPVNATTANDQWWASTGSDADGNFVVVWQSNFQDGAGWGVYARLFDPDGNPITGEIAVNQYTDSNQYYANVSVNRAGDWVVVWQSNGQDGDSWGAYARVFEPDGDPVGDEFRVNEFTTGSQGDPKVALADDGSFTVVWYSGGTLDGDGLGVFARRFDPAGNPLGHEFQVNEYTTGDQEEPGIASDSAGVVFIAWESDGQDGDGVGIYGRLIKCAAADDCDDANVCTADFCDSNGVCQHANTDAVCEDGVFCNGLDWCQAGECTQHLGDPCGTGETCDEDAGECLPDVTTTTTSTTTTEPPTSTTTTVSTSTTTTTQPDSCAVCVTTGECTGALGAGWGCVDGCCVFEGDDDDSDDDSASGDDDDDDSCCGCG